MVYRRCSYANNMRNDSSIIKSKDRVVINVGGSRHECYLSTIQNFPDTRLYWIAESAKKMVDFDPDRNEFFFDRHPGCFQNILNYCRTGKLHCPNDVCGPLFEQELGFWGVDELMMEPCCWGNYTQHREAHKNLRMFDKIYSDETEEQEDEDQDNIHTSSSDQSRAIKSLMSARKIIWGIMEKPFFARQAQVYALINMVIIITSILTFCLQTVKSLDDSRGTFKNMEYFYCAYFTLEFLVRMAVCPSLKRFFKSAMTWIDFVSTMQFYYDFGTGGKDTLDFLFVSRLIRIFRLFRFFKNLSGMQVIYQALKSSAQELCLLAILMCIPTLIFSTLMFYAENGNRKENSSGSHDFASIPRTCWWAVITMTTVGYGDLVPTSFFGQLIGIMCCCSGIVILALPVSVIGSNFSLYYSYAQARMRLPKRRSPALVTADKALVHDGLPAPIDDSHQKPKVRQRQKGKVPNTLHGLADVMVDITVPGMERRHAIMPSVSPVSRQKRRSIMTRQNNKASVDSLMVPPMAVNQNSEGNNSRCASPTALRSKRASTANTLKTFLSKLGNTSATDQTLANMSQSDDGALDRSCLNTSPGSHRKKRSLHIDILQYRPRKLSRDEYLIRKKMSQSEFMPWMKQQLVSNAQTVDDLPDTIESPIFTGIPLVVTEEESIDDGVCGTPLLTGNAIDKQCSTKYEDTGGEWGNGPPEVLNLAPAVVASNSTALS